MSIICQSCGGPAGTSCINGVSTCPTCSCGGQPSTFTMGERYCLWCDKDGHQTHECRSTHAINTPAARELARLTAAHDMAHAWKTLGTMMLEAKRASAEIDAMAIKLGIPPT